MKISIIIVSTLLVLSVFIPFFLFILNGTKHSSNIKKQFESIIKNNGLSYLHQEIWHSYFIGLCVEKKTITYIHGNTQHLMPVVILLSDVKSCNIIKTLKKDKNKIMRLESLSLEFKFDKQENLLIGFFNSDEDLIEDYELDRIEKWHKIIKEHSLYETIMPKKAS